MVAIAITLLVLQLNVPDPAKLANPDSASELATQLSKGADQLISYVVSFYVIAQFWLVHHRVFRRITGQQEGLAWWNFAFLFTITVMPFTSDLLGKYSANPLAVDIFAVDLLAASLATQLTLVYGRRRHLLTAETPGNSGGIPARGGKRAGHRLVHRHCLGEYGAAKYCGYCLLPRPGLLISGPAVGSTSASRKASRKSYPLGNSGRP